ncbi:hypothetical protein ASPZODRAFT_133472 [Penicilliopsis zonata CBS 506.65]|uniref:Ubiquitin-protein ligase Sel1/Ubx2 n=1 Tax=Penicilliopsis zonata CBS 506.65 TaxID=1073090 RepID=A0A1L9SEU9_9EURO|nr:hypothetical protein ASPZODRAFT_133472 [Penicilliopsis zonata CBS 506.65]OJJ45617.1 hypothetical protein ASPZODRAFT_133472 [Penicilliopsis zonata CBS 506.65]
MRTSSFQRFLPLALLLVQALAIDSNGHLDDAKVLDDVTAEPLQAGDGSGSRVYEQADALPGSELVESALRTLREAKVVAVVQAEKPSGLLGNALYYGYKALRVLFLNNPHAKSTEPKLDPQVARAVQKLRTAAEEDLNPDAMFLLAEMNFYGNFTHPRDFRQAFEWYDMLAALEGNSTAQYMLGFMYATGIGDAVERDQAKSLMYHTFAAEGGNTRSEMTLAYRNHAGIGTSRNCDHATYYYKKVADKAIEYYRSGPPGGHGMIRESYRWADEEGGVYGEGASVSSAGPNALRDAAQAGADASLEDVLEFFDLMSRKGNVEATFGLAKIHYEGARTMPRNFRKAMKYFKQITKRYWNKDGSVNPNHPQNIEKLASKAAGHIGVMYLRGEGVEQNFATAMTWFKRGLRNGDALCQHEIGLMYLHGYGVPQDAYKASSYFRAAADQGYPAAETRLGALFLDQGDVATATRYFELAARLGWMEAFYYLAELSNNGIGRERHCGIAASYYKMVAERAEMIHSSIIEANDAYERGDRERALIPAMMAAEQGYEHAQANVAYLLDDQRSLLSLDSLLPWASEPKPSLLRNAALALIYWTRSSKQANIDSLVKMGDYYLAGNGAMVDTEKASTCYHTAAEAHHSAQAYWNLGWMHENGIAVEQDFHMAKRYYDLALATNTEAYLPVKLSLIKLRLRSFWNTITHGKANSIQEDEEPRPRRTFKEWIIAFIENTEEEEANYRAQLARQRGDDGDEEGLLGAGDSHQDGYYDDLELDIDESLLEGLIIVTLAATLLVLIYLRQQRNRPGANNNNNNNNNNAGGVGAANANPPAAANAANDRGFFPQPGEPEFAQWVAGGVGH